jgi:hypothetical protein
MRARMMMFWVTCAFDAILNESRQRQTSYQMLNLFPLNESMQILNSFLSHQSLFFFNAKVLGHH